MSRTNAVNRIAFTLCKKGSLRAKLASLAVVGMVIDRSLMDSTSKLTKRYWSSVAGKIATVTLGITGLRAIQAIYEVCVSWAM